MTTKRARAMTQSLILMTLAAGVTVAQDKPTVNPTCEAAYVTALGGGREAPVLDARAQIFRTLATSDLEVLVVVPAALQKTPAGSFEVRLTTPNGYHYGSYPIAVGDPKQEKDRKLDGYRLPVKVQLPVSRVLPGGGKAPAVTARVPVAGSDIISSGLYGTWGVEIVALGQGACARSELVLEK
jgi:hypothetical protein